MWGRSTKQRRAAVRRRLARLDAEADKLRLAAFQAGVKASRKAKAAAKPKRPAKLIKAQTKRNRRAKAQVTEV